MKSTRRDFMKQCAAGCLVCSMGLSGEDSEKKKVDLSDLSKFTYCGFQCSDECKLLTTTKNNDLEGKKKAYEEWKMKERYGIEFDADKIYCWGCKVPEEKQGVVIQACKVRPCAIGKKYESCIQCDQINNCDQELWTQFSKFRDYVVQLHEQYTAMKTEG